MPHPHLSPWLALLAALLLPGCAHEIKDIPRPRLEIASHPDVGPRVRLEVNAGKFSKGSEIGVRAVGGMENPLVLEDDLEARLRGDIARAWSEPGTGQVPWRVRVSIEQFDIRWPWGFNPTATGKVALRLQLFPAQSPTAIPVYDRLHEALSRKEFGTAGSIEAEDWVPILHTAYLEAVTKLVTNEEALALLAGDPQGAAPGPRPVVAGTIVAIFDLADASNVLDEPTRAQLTAYLAAALVRTGLFKTIPRDQLRARLFEQKKDSYRPCMDEACQIELGKALAAEKSLAVQILRMGKKCALAANLYDLKSETAEKSALVNTDCSTEDLLRAMDQVAGQLSAP